VRITAIPHQKKRRKKKMRRWALEKRKGRRSSLRWIVMRVMKWSRRGLTRRVRSILRRIRGCPGPFGRGRWLREGSGLMVVGRIRRGS